MCYDIIKHHVRSFNHISPDLNEGEIRVEPVCILSQTNYLLQMEIWEDEEV